MKKQLLLLMFAFLCSMGMWAADTYEHTFATNAKTFENDGTVKLSNVEWTLATTWVDASKKDYNRDTSSPSQGMKIGANKNQIQTMSLSTSGITGTITSVYVETNARSGADVKMSVTVGGTAFSGDASFTGTGVYDTRQQLTYTGSASGQVVIAWDQTDANDTKKGAFYVTKIKVTYSLGDVTYYNVNIANDIQYGTVEADKKTAIEGATVTLTPTPANGYKFGSWNVKNASTNADITVTNNKFTMPAANVNVSATFVEKPVPVGQTVAFVLEYGNKMLAAGVNIASIKAPAVEVTVEDGKVVVYSEDDAEKIAWVVAESETEGKYTIQPKNDAEKYLSAASSSANLSLSTTKCLWTDKGDGTYWIPKADGTQNYYRTITYQASSTSAFKAYTASNLGSSGYATTAAVAMPIVVKKKHDLTIHSNGWSSLALDFNAEVPEGTSAYYASAKDLNGTEGTITLKRIAAGEVIPAGEGVIVKGTGKVTFVESTEEPVEITNLFSGTATEEATVAANSAWVLNSASSTADAPYFSLFTSTTIPVNKAYIATEAVGGAKTLIFSVDDNVATSISNVENTMTSGVAYNLAGQRVAATAKGIVIMNGKKYINK